MRLESGCRLMTLIHMQQKGWDTRGMLGHMQSKGGKVLSKERDPARFVRGWRSASCNREVLN